MKKSHDVPELSDKDWIPDLGFSGCDCISRQTKYQNAVQGPFCASDVQCSEDFPAKIAASFKPSDGQHSYPLAKLKEAKRSSDDLKKY